MVALLLNPHAVLLLLPLAAEVDPISWLVNYGVAGIVLALLVTGQLRTKSEVLGVQKIADDRAREVAAKDAAIAALMTQITGHTVPQLGHLTQVLEALPAQNTSDTAVLEALAELKSKIEQIEQKSGGR